MSPRQETANRKSADAVVVFGRLHIVSIRRLSVQRAGVHPRSLHDDYRRSRINTPGASRTKNVRNYRALIERNWPVRVVYAFTRKQKPPEKLQYAKRIIVIAGRKPAFQ